MARDPALAYPENGYGVGIGPIAGVAIPVTEMVYDTAELKLTSRDGTIRLEYESGTVTVFEGRT